MKILKIEECAVCPYNYAYPEKEDGLIRIKHQCLYGKKPLVLDRDIIFPTWCPLEDAKDD